MPARWDMGGEHDAAEPPIDFSRFKGMSRPVEDIPLPGDELPSHHALYKSGDRSVCPWHSGQCAYSGSEPDRCPVCHALWNAWGDDYNEHAQHIATRLKADLKDGD
jgi:hypothetical protein